jgi:hypothetical protein
VIALSIEAGDCVAFYHSFITIDFTALLVLSDLAS